MRFRKQAPDQVGFPDLVATVTDSEFIAVFLKQAVVDPLPRAWEAFLSEMDDQEFFWN